MAELLVAVLAAGGASRFGGGKLDADCAGRRLGRWALDAVSLAGLPAGIIVTGPEAPAFANEALEWQSEINAQPEEGLGTSVAQAARHAMEYGHELLLLLLADMPLIDPGFLRLLAGAEPVAATVHQGGRAGVPALFGRRHLAELSRLEGDRGAGVLLNQARNRIELLSAPEGSLLDVDTPDQLARAAKLLRWRGRV